MTLPVSDGEELIADCETDNLLDKMTKVWIIQIGTVDGEEVDLYADQPGFKPLAEGVARLRAAKKVIGHNFLGFDLWAINMIYPDTIRRAQVVDTLVMSRLADPERKHHSLDALGQDLGILKGKYQGDFQTFDDELVTYARQDIVVTRALYRKLEAKLEGWGYSTQLEHDVAWAIILQEQNGFPFDSTEAELLLADLRGEQAELDVLLQAAFPPITRTETRIAGASNKKLGRVKGQPYVVTSVEPFNPASRKQIGERLMMLGWKPKNYGADGAPTVDEGTLSNLPYPEAKLMVQYLALGKKIGMLADGKNGWLKMVKDGRIHGRVNPNGACTGRMSHFKPNVAQADKDKRMRRLWKPRKGWKQVGCDAEGLEARMLGHYLARYDGGAFAERVVNGDKALGTDVHTVNMKAVNKLGFQIDREGAKTLLYALMYGAGDFKLAATVRSRLRELGQPTPKMPQKELGLLVRRSLESAMKGLGDLTKAVKAKAKSQGYLIGLDGRRLLVRSEHSALNTLLQGGGAIVMKKALCLFMERHGDHHGTDYGLCANVHDEVQLEADPAVAEALGKDMAAAIAEAGEFFSLRCVLAGAYDVGDNWSETH